MESGSLAEWIGVIVTGAGLIFIWLQIRDARHTSKGQFLLDLDAAMRTHDEIHRYLLLNDNFPEEITETEVSPENRILLAKLIAYLGLFERIHILVNDGGVSINEIDSLYGYRLERLICDEAIYMYLNKYHTRWQGFIRLTKQLLLYRNTTNRISAEMFAERVEAMEVIPFKSELEWRFRGSNIIYYDQPEFTIVVKRNNRLPDE